MNCTWVPNKFTVTVLFDMKLIFLEDCKPIKRTVCTLFLSDSFSRSNQNKADSYQFYVSATNALDRYSSVWDIEDW